MDGDRHVSVRVLDGIGEIEAEAWDRCAAPEANDAARPDNPFLTHRFLSAFEESGSATLDEGWDPKHLVVEATAGDVLGVMPLYAKYHSQGEYIFDHGWANAFERAGGRYYPKLLSAIPFTPVSARKLLCDPGAEPELVRDALIAGATRLAVENGVSSVHVNFCLSEDRDALVRNGYLRRSSQQFHWLNDGYEDFDAFLASLSSRKRKAIRKERAKAHEPVEIVELSGDDICPEHWDAMWLFYQDTGARKWGTPYLNRDFFALAHERLRDDILLVLCRREGEWIAGALNVIGRDTLYGRYWGCLEDHPCLHFEVCYYRAIDYAIRHGLSRVEAGAQGEHKLARGYVPIEMHSAHLIVDPSFRAAVARYLAQEAELVGDEMALLGEYTPFRKG